MIQALLGLMIASPMMFAQDSVNLGDGQDPVFSSDGKMIVFVKSGQICTMDIHGKNLRRLTPGSNNARPAWSPTSSQIVFQSYGFGAEKIGTFSIWTVNADGSNLRKLIEQQGEGQSPRWSKDGKQVVWSHDNQIWIVDADGHNAHPLTMHEPREWKKACDFSPGGDTLAYLTSQGGASVYYVGLVTIHGKILPPPVDILTAQEVRWSADGLSLFYSWNNELRQFPLNGLGEDKVLLLFDNDLWGFDLSPTNSRIIYDDSGPERSGEIIIRSLK